LLWHRMVLVCPSRRQMTREPFRQVVERDRHHSICRFFRWAYVVLRSIFPLIITGDSIPNESKRLLITSVS
jgi:hypothetical protein